MGYVAFSKVVMVVHRVEFCSVRISLEFTVSGQLVAADDMKPAPSRRMGVQQ
jgi:hypothetical protein